MFRLWSLLIISFRNVILYSTSLYILHVQFDTDDDRELKHVPLVLLYDDNTIDYLKVLINNYK